MGDQSGSIVPIYALLAIAMMMIIGLTVDFRRVENAQSRMQDAVDSAVLAAAKEYINLNISDLTEDERQAAAKEKGRAYFLANLGADELMIDGADVNIVFGDGTGEITAHSTGDLELAFGGFAGIPTQDISATAAAAAGDPRRLEVVLALDNSVSMFYDNRLVLLRAAAKDFVDIVFDGSMGPNTVQIGVVPWAASVNILSEQPLSWDAAAGSTVVPGNGGTKTTPNAPYNHRRDYLYEAGGYSGSYTSSELAEAFAPVGWRGCVAAAKNERRVNSSGAVTTALTDDPPNPMKWPALLNAPAITERYVHTGYGSQASGGCKDFDFYDFGGSCGVVNYDAPTSAQCRGSGCNIPSCSQNFNHYNHFVYNDYIPSNLTCTNSGYSVASSTLSECISDPNEHAWWNGDTSRTACPGVTFSDWNSTADINDSVTGPNLTCPSAMLPMSQSRPQIFDKLNHIYPTWEGTQADVGLMWAMRLLTDNATWTNFWGYSTDAAPLAFDSTRVRKMVVLLTDGKNEFPNWGDGYYGCAASRSSYGRDNCLKADGMDSLTNTALDNLMLDACTALKDQDVEVFTIALDLDASNTSQAASIALLEQCATSSSYAYNITSGELDETFQSLARKALRLTK